MPVARGKKLHESAVTELLLLSSFHKSRTLSELVDF